MSHHDWIAPEEHQLTAAQMQDLWRVSRESGMSRRDFVRLLAAGGSTAVLSACDRRADTPHTPSDPEDAPWVKNPAPFIRHPTNLETRLENLTGFLTPNSQFSCGTMRQRRGSTPPPIVCAWKVTPCGSPSSSATTTCFASLAIP